MQRSFGSKAKIAMTRAKGTSKHEGVIVESPIIGAKLTGPFGEGSSNGASGANTRTLVSDLENISNGRFCKFRFEG